MPNGYAILPLLLLVTACERPPSEQDFALVGDPARGKVAIERVGCGSCHSIEGIDWPRGKVGPPLRGFANRALIGGRVPNEPEQLARFVRNAPEVLPGTIMPSMPLSETESRDVAAYLYKIGGR